MMRLLMRKYSRVLIMRGFLIIIMLALFIPIINVIIFIAVFVVGISRTWIHYDRLYARTTDDNREDKSDE